MTLIEEFLKRYLREYDYFHEVAKLCSQKCETLLEENGIRSIVTYRAKRPDRLESKISERAKKKGYKSLDEISADIVDLAGVRIALYFPGDQREVHKLLVAHFTVKNEKTFSGSEGSPDNYRNRFPGYCAKHYLIQLREDSLPDANKRYARASIEIQVASVLMHAWAEVEHDLLYKPFTGTLSEDEHAILDELNGLVISGEVALERLQRAVQARVKGQNKPFANHYELAAYLLDSMKLALAKEPFMGRTDVLLSFLRLADLDRPQELARFSANLDPYLETRPIAEQIIDRILEKTPKLYPAFDQVKEELEARAPYRTVGAYKERELGQEYLHSIGFFLSRWITFERAVLGIGKLLHPLEPRKWRLLGETLPYLGFDLSALEQIETFRRVRNNLVHGHELANVQTLNWAGQTIEKLLHSLCERAKEEMKEVVEKAISEMKPEVTGYPSAALWTLRERGVQLRNKLITLQDLPQWESEFEAWHSELLAEAEKASSPLRHWLSPLDKVTQWDLTPWVNEEHRRNLNMLSETLHRLEEYLTKDIRRTPDS